MNIEQLSNNELTELIREVLICAIQLDDDGKILLANSIRNKVQENDTPAVKGFLNRLANIIESEAVVK
ncbi:hypothetical protein [Enterococcus sp. HY326]|uniref:hypothetical protein n=1 Tax=Enterococcus sp. HY326 TaxID=2971265 RepID=UPI00223FC8C3|nr:hypothetical protein [Enterococcus sp. HY326]